MSNDLVPTNFGSNTVTVDQKEIRNTEIAKTLQSGTSSFLPRIQQAVDRSEIAKPVKLGGKGAIHGEFYLVRDSNAPLIPLGEKFDCVIIAARMKGLAYKTGEAREGCFEDGDNVVSGGDNEFFELCQARDRDDPKEHDNWKYNWGAEFLIWLNDHNCFATLFCGTWTARNVALEYIYPHFASCSPCTANMTIYQHYIDKGKNPRWSYLATECSTAPQFIPEQEELEKRIKEFKNPKSFNKDEAVATDTEAEDR